MAYGRELFAAERKGACFHEPDIRTLRESIADADYLDPIGCAAALAVAARVEPRCRLGIDPSRPNVCPRIADIEELVRYRDHSKEQRELWAAHENERLRKFPLDPKHREFAASVDIAMEEAYFMLAMATGRSMREISGETGYCSNVSIIAQQLLQRRDHIGTQMMEYKAYEMNHYFLRTTEIPDIPDETFDLDGTWQQFADFGTDLSEQPHVLIVPASQRKQAALAQGCLRPYIHYDAVLGYAKPRPITYEDFNYGYDGIGDLDVSPVVRIFEAEGWTHSS